MHYFASPHRRCAGRARIAVIVLLFLLLGAAGAIAGYLLLGGRTGEAAMERLIPADAQFAATLDLKPSTPEQAALFARLSQQFRREGLDTKLDELLADGDAPPVLRDIRPYLSGGVTVAGLPAANNGAFTSGPEVLVVFSVRDADTVEKKLRDGAESSEKRGGVEVFRLPERGESSKTFCAVLDDYLVMGEKPETLLRAAAVQRGDAPALAKQEAFRQARKALPADANLMLFVSPGGLREAGSQATAGGLLASNSPLKGAQWAVFGATLREDGVIMEYRCPWSADTLPAVLKPLGQIAAFDANTLRRLPPGALGVVGVSEPGRLWDVTRAVSDEAGRGARTALNDGVASVERETGLSIPGDVAPAFTGNTLLVAYPSERGPEEEPDFLLVVDDARGADPAALAEKLRRRAERSDTNLGFDAREVNGSTVWTVARGDMDSGMSRLTTTERIVRDGKNVAYAQIGKAVLLASSERLLERAVGTYSADGGKDGLTAQNPEYARMMARFTPGAQSVVLVSPAQFRSLVLPALEREIERGSSGSPLSGFTPDDLFDLIGANKDTGFVASVRYDGNAMSGSVFLPMDPEQAIRLLGIASRQMSR